MKIVVAVVSIIPFLWGIYVASFFGLDLRKWSDWKYGGVSFISGVAVAITAGSSLVVCLLTGIIFAFLTLFGGVMTRRHKRETQKMTKEFLSQYENDELPPLLARLVKKLLDKYK